LENRFGQWRREFLFAGLVVHNPPSASIYAGGLRHIAAGGGWSSSQGAAVPFETRNASSYVIAFDNTAGLATGVAIANFSALGADMTAIVRGEDGSQIGAISIPLPAQGHTSFMLADKFSATARIRGTVEFGSPPGVRIVRLEELDQASHLKSNFVSLDRAAHTQASSPLVSLSWAICC
jgi:hypothetical protein